MTGVWLSALIRWCIRSIVVLSLVAAGRLALVAWQLRSPTVVLTPVNMNDSEPPRSPLSALGLDGLRHRLAPSIPSELLAPALLGAAGGATRPNRTQVYLVINVAPDRSEVIINGVAQGHTPYVGETTCKSNGTLEIVVLPPKGTPKRFERSCDRSELRIEER